MRLKKNGLRTDEPLLSRPRIVDSVLVCVDSAVAHVIYCFLLKLREPIDLMTFSGADSLVKIKQGTQPSNAQSAIFSKWLYV